MARPYCKTYVKCLNTACAGKKMVHIGETEASREIQIRSTASSNGSATYKMKAYWTSACPHPIVAFAVGRPVWMEGNVSLAFK